MKARINMFDNNNNNSNDTDTDLSKEDTAVAYTGLVTEFKQIDDDKHTRPLRKSSSSSKKNKCNNNSTGGNLTNTNFTSGYHNLRKHPVIKQTHKQSIKKTFYNNSKHSLYKIFKKTITKEKNNNSFVNVSKEDIGTLCQLNMSTGSTHEHINNEHHSLIKIIKLTDWLINVATAAPDIPISNVEINIGSKIIFSTPPKPIPILAAVEPPTDLTKCPNTLFKIVGILPNIIVTTA